ncbi:hypothetical protein K523DRAFT_406153 [Schizophyllum commune Tattone D]|nr:hypothetical protein K523DRAFT_406153 [Schizophyllum commune Tattone D]
MKLSAVFAIATVALASVVGAAPIPETNGQRLARGLPPLRPRYIADGVFTSLCASITADLSTTAATPVKRNEPPARALRRGEPSARTYRKRNEPSARAYAF